MTYRQPGSNWTQDEIDYAHDHPYEEHAEKYPHRTHEAWRVKRNRTKPSWEQPMAGEGVTLTVKPAATEEEWEELFASLERADGARAALSPTQESTEWVSPDDKPVGVCFLGDVHAGASGVLYQELRADLETIRDTDGLYVCGMGDYLENTKVQAKSASALYHSLFASPSEQIAYVITRLSIAQGKWICLVGGNHDAFDGKWAGIDRLPALAAHLETAYFGERGGTVFAQVGATRYAIVVKHDYRGRSTINKSNAQRRAWDEWPEWINADVLCLAHLHEPDLHVTMRKGQAVTYLRSGTYKTVDPWAESNGYKPAYGVPVVILYPDKRRTVPFSDLRDGVAYLTRARG